MLQISVIVPAYNVEEYVEKCVKSILKQTFDDYEILLIDDGSKDNTGFICDVLAKQNKKVRVFHKQNGGLSSARNYGLDRMLGRYVTFVDSDDFIAEDYLETLYNLITLADNIDISMLQIKSLLEDDIPDKTEKSDGKIIKNEQAICMMLLRKKFSHTSCGKLFSVELWKDFRFPIGELYEDYATTYKVFSEAKEVALAYTEKYFYVQHRGSIMHKECSTETLSVLDVADNVSRFISTNLPDCKLEALDLQAAVYLKTMQNILNCGIDKFKEQQKHIIRFIKRNAPNLLFSKKVPKTDKYKILLLFFGRRIFLKIYNINDGDIKI